MRGLFVICVSLLGAFGLMCWTLVLTHIFAPGLFLLLSGAPVPVLLAVFGLTAAAIWLGLRFSILIKES
jgi:hypothetical protein